MHIINVCRSNLFLSTLETGHRSRRIGLVRSAPERRTCPDVVFATSASFSKLIDLNMLVMNGGRERTTAEFCALLKAADYKLTRIVPTMAPQSVIEAIAN